MKARRFPTSLDALFVPPCNGVRRTPCRGVEEHTPVQHLEGMEGIRQRCSGVCPWITRHHGSHAPAQAPDGSSPPRPKPSTSFLPNDRGKGRGTEDDKMVAFAHRIPSSATSPSDELGDSSTVLTRRARDLRESGLSTLPHPPTN